MQLAHRQIIQLAKETRYGVDPGGGVGFPAQLAFGDLPVSAEVDVVRTATGGTLTGGGALRASGARRQVPALTTLLCEEDDDALLSWTWLAEASGLAYQQALSTASRRVWRASSGRAGSNTLRWWVDGEKHVVPGLRGALTLTATVGQPVVLAFAGTGRYVDVVPSGNPVTGFVVGTPITCCGIGLTIAYPGEPVITPTGVVQVVLQTGTVLSPIAPGGRDSRAYEWRVMDVIPSLQITCETQTAFEWSRLLEKRGRVQFGFGTSPRWTVDAPEMVLAGLPSKTTLDSGAVAESVVVTAAGRSANSVLEIARVA